MVIAVVVVIANDGDVMRSDAVNVDDCNCKELRADALMRLNANEVNNDNSAVEYGIV